MMCTSVFSEKLTWDLIRDPIYDYIPYNKEVEAEVIDTLVFQRLRRIRQLQMAYYVYPGADHTRFQHSIGVMHVAGLFAQQLIKGLLRSFGEEGLKGYKAESLIEASRLAGLLHDLGHGPFGHAFEEAILSSNELSQKKLSDHERLGLLLVKYTEVEKIIKEAENLGLDNLYELVENILAEETPSCPLLQLFRKTVKAWLYPADILDFLMRDAYYAGTREYGSIDYLRLINHSHPYPEEDKYNNIVIETKALGALRSYLYSRMSMYEYVYFHPVVTAFNRVLVEAMREADNYLGLTEAVEKLGEGEASDYISLDDWHIIIGFEKLLNEYKKTILHKEVKEEAQPEVK